MLSPRKGSRSRGGTRDLSTEAMLLANVGVVLAASGDLDEAEHALEESVRRGASARERHAASGTGSGHSGRSRWLDATTRRRGCASRRVLPWDARSATGGRSLTRSRTLRSWHWRRETRTQRERMLAESIAIEREAGDRLGLAGNLEVFARLAVAQGRPARACPPQRVRKRAPRVRGLRRVRGRVARSRAGRRPPPCRTRRGRIRRGVGAGMRDDVG